MDSNLIRNIWERWLEDEKYKGFINEHWVRPSENEKPKQFSTIEKGCYW